MTIPEIKPCKYDCGTRIRWSDIQKFWINADTGELHTYRKCAEIQKQQGKIPTFPDQKIKRDIKI